jgi:hypothetical protein
MRWKRFEGVVVLPPQGINNLAVELLVHQKMAESARRHDADA